MSFARAKSIVDIGSTLLVTIAACLMIWTLFFKERLPTAAQNAPPSVQDVKETIPRAYLTNFVGNGEIAIVEFTDFQCPFCARHNKVTVPRLRSEFIDTGKVRYILMHFPLDTHAEASRAAEAAECAAEQGQFWKMHDLLFERQLALVGADFSSYAKELRLDVEAFDRCLARDDALQRVIANKKEAERLQVRSTPGFFLARVRLDGGVDLLRRINGAKSFEVFSTELRKLIRL